MYHDLQGLACVGLKMFRGKQEALLGGAIKALSKIFCVFFKETHIPIRCGFVGGIAVFFINSHPRPPPCLNDSGNKEDLSKSYYNISSTD